MHRFRSVEKHLVNCQYLIIMAIDEQDFSSLLEQEEQLGCEIDECNIFLWLDLGQQIGETRGILRPLVLVV